MSHRLGVGIIGGGLATQAIHLPTLAKLGDVFRVVRVMDVEGALADNVSARCGARPALSVEEVCEDPAVDVVAICSPHTYHASQAIAACRAGKRLVLVEKPLAETREEALAVVRAAAEAGTQVIVGAMHVYDPAYRAARQAWDECGDEARHVHSSIFLPSNDQFIDQATDRVPAPVGARRRPPDHKDPSVQAKMLRAAILGLAIHNLPLVRSFAPKIESMKSARFLPAFGYEISFTGAGRSVCLVALMPGTWDPHWSLRAIGRTHELEAKFPPSYVLAGSSRATIRNTGQLISFERDESGYEAMWRQAHAVASGVEKLLARPEDIVADFNYALDLADQVDEFLGVKP